MGTEITMYNDPFEGDFIEKAWGLASRISKTSFVPDVFRNKPEEVLSAILSGREVGVGPMQSLQKINVIKGKPTQSAELMRALVQAQGHEIWVDDYTTTRVSLCGRRAGQEHINTVTWTMDDAKRAKLDAKENWRGYPRAMLLARATGELCRLMFADVLGGISYTPEEIDDGLLELVPTGEVGTDADAEPAKAITRKAAPSKRAATRAGARPVTDAPPLPPLPGEDDAPAESESVVKARSQQIAMKCQQAGLDDDGRHSLIEAVTNGRVRSSKEVTADEGADVLAALAEINAGRKELVESDGEWVLVEVEDATGDGDASLFAGTEADPEPDVTQPGGWNAETWRSFLTAHGVKQAELLREANRLCGMDGAPFGVAPSKLADLAGRADLCGLLVGFVLDKADQS